MLFPGVSGLQSGLSGLLLHTLSFSLSLYFFLSMPISLCSACLFSLRTSFFFVCVSVSLFFSSRLYLIVA